MGQLYPAARGPLRPRTRGTLRLGGAGLPASAYLLRTWTVRDHRRGLTCAIEAQCRSRAAPGGRMGQSRRRDTQYPLLKQLDEFGGCDRRCGFS